MSALKFNDVIRLPIFSAAPTAMQAGMYYDSDDDMFYGHNGTSWKALAYNSAIGVTFDDSVFRIYDNGDNTKLIAFEASNIDTGTVRTLTMPNRNHQLGAVEDWVTGTKYLVSDIVVDSGKLYRCPTGEAHTAGASFAVDLAAGKWVEISALPSLTDGKLWIGDATNAAVGVTLTGDVTTSNAGVTKVKFANNTAVQWRNAADDGDISPLKVNASDILELGTNFSIGTNVLVQGGDGIKRGATAANFVEQEYYHALTLTANTVVATEISASLSFDTANYEACEISYFLKEATSDEIALGTLRVLSNGTAVAYNDIRTDSSDILVTFTASLNTGVVEINYTNAHATNDVTLRCDVKRYLAI